MVNIFLIISIIALSFSGIIWLSVHNEMRKYFPSLKHDSLQLTYAVKYNIFEPRMPERLQVMYLLIYLLLSVASVFMLIFALLTVKPAMVLMGVLMAAGSIAALWSNVKQYRACQRRRGGV
jgi:hypothetical protein